ITFVDASEDDTKLLLWAGSDVDPGRYYVFDRTAKKLTEIMLTRPPLEGATLAPVKSVTFTATDGTQIPAYLTLPPGSDGKNLPTIVMPHGGPESRDEWGFDWLAQYFAARGFAVLQPNFRGSAGYGQAWFVENGFKSWRTAIGDVNDGGRWLIAQGIADPARLAIVGWSYGGYAALQSAVLDPDLFKAIIAIAPVTDLGKTKEEARYFANYGIVSDFIGDGPHINEGSPARNATRFKAPVLMFHGEMDANVGVAQSRLMEARLKEAGRPVELVTYPRLDHGLLDSRVRIGMLDRSDVFLRKTLALDPRP
ncbi:MAG: alpha/beta hydrolase family protein, partial [Sphingomonas sp.]